MREPPAIAAARLGVFTVAEARAAGWSDRELSYAVQCGRLTRLRRGVFVSTAAGDAPEDTGFVGTTSGAVLGHRGLAAALTVDASVLSHAAAAAVLQLPLLRTPARPCLTLPPGYLTNTAGLHLHRHRLPAEQIRTLAGVRLTSPARTCIDLAREEGLAAGLVAADAAVHAGICTPTELQQIYDVSCRGRAGLRDGRRLLELIDGRAESPLESISRLAMTNLPPPRTQVTILSPAGIFLGRVDFYWDEYGVVGEADGRGKYSGDALWREKRRQDLFTDHGLVVERWNWDTARRLGELEHRLDAAFRRAERLRAAGIQPQVRVL